VQEFNIVPTLCSDADVRRIVSLVSDNAPNSWYVSKRL
jgi:hypothetical protein